jgi:hypothetical protein
MYFFLWFGLMAHQHNLRYMVPKQERKTRIEINKAKATFTGRSPRHFKKRLFFANFGCKAKLNVKTASPLEPRDT